MRRILVPLDGSEVAESILPDACRLAGTKGEIILVNDTGTLAHHPPHDCPATWASQDYVHSYLHTVGQMLQLTGARVTVHAARFGDPARMIDAVAGTLHVDMIVCATHGRSPLSRLLHGGIAWSAAIHAPVPIMLRHVGNDHGSTAAMDEPERRAILVPLDGSTLAERALPLACTLAAEWKAAVHLVRVVVNHVAEAGASTFAGWSGASYPAERCMDRATEYLHDVRDTMMPGAEVQTLYGGAVVDLLARYARQEGISDVVMSTHGHTGLSRVMLGSVADSLVHRLSCPVTLVPPAYGCAERQALQRPVSTAGARRA